MAGYSEKLAIFQSRPNNDGELLETYIDYKSQGQLHNDSSLHFHVANNGSTYIDLSKSKLVMKVKIVRKDGVAMKNTDIVSTANIPIHAMWRRMEFFLRDKLVSGSDTMYPYKAYIDCITKITEQEQKTGGGAMLYYKDTPPFFDDIATTLSDMKNEGFKSRYVAFMNGRTVELIDTPKLDFFNSDKLVINGVPMDLKLFPSSSEFVLLSKNNDYEMKLIECSFRVCHVQVNPDIVLAHSEIMSEGTVAEYPFAYSDMKSYTIPPGLSSFSVDNMWLDRVPTNVVLAFVNSDSYNGKIDKNPFRLDNNNTQQVALYVNGTPVPNRPIEANFDQRIFTDAYLRLGEKKQNLSKYEFGYGYTLFNMKIRAKDTIGARGYTRMEIKFGTPLPAAVVLLMYATFDKKLTISKVRGVEIEDY
jgi:hypothetical protein